MTTEEAIKVLDELDVDHMWPNQRKAQDTLKAALAASEAARERAEKVNSVLSIEARAAYSHIHLILMDLARRIGIASRPEWVRDEIEKEANKYAAWARAKAATLDAPATGE